jgi:hypothetical protein
LGRLSPVMRWAILVARPASFGRLASGITYLWRATLRVMASERSGKVVRSYRLVFQRRWRIFRIKGWRIPLPGGLELRLLAYWLSCLVAIAALGRLPVLGAALAALPPSLRLLALPIAAAWALSHWELDGRSPHRALAGLLAYLLRPRVIAAGRRCPRPGAGFAPLGELTLGPDLSGPCYPHGRLVGPARILLRYPVRVALEGVPRRGPAGSAQLSATAKRWRISPAGRSALHRAQRLEVPPGRTVIFERSAARGDR